jgi:hypothetical protein
MPLTGRIEYLRRQALSLEAVARYRALDDWERGFARKQAIATWNELERVRKQMKGSK